ncbi:helix-turn-helix domain-containing protein [Brevundimonas sp.]|uniref:AraC-like ligand-binding domain-containing protein n=1 Tax=Brevundimonas sp. TaxID=1871086 RepID=UPI002ED7CD21
MLDAAEQADAAALYRRACAHLFEITLLSPVDRFRNRLEGYNLDGVVFGSCEGVAQRFRRDQRHISADGSDAIQAVLVLESEGWRADYDGRLADDGMGSIRLVDMARPFDLTTGAFRTLNIMLPRTLLGDAGRRDLHGLIISEDSASGHLLGAHLRKMWEYSDTVTAAEAAGIVTAAAGLIASTIAAHAVQAGPAAPLSERSLLAAARALVDDHLDDPDLTPAILLARLKVSRGQLYRALTPAGGVASFIQTRRLDRAFDAIVGDPEERRTLGEIGYAHGFRSDAHFNRVFRARFGVPPGRLRGRGGPAPAGISVIERPDDVWTWLRSV